MITENVLPNEPERESKECYWCPNCGTLMKQGWANADTRCAFEYTAFANQTGKEPKRVKYTGLANQTDKKLSQEDRDVVGYIANWTGKEPKHVYKNLTGKETKRVKCTAMPKAGSSFKYKCLGCKECKTIVCQCHAEECVERVLVQGLR